MKQYQGQYAIYLFLLMVALGFTGWYYAQPSFEIKKLPQETLAHIPDSIVTDVDVTQFNKLGQLSTHFYTPKLTHYPANNWSQFTTPRIVLYPEKGEPWFIQADEGQAENGYQIIRLMNNVTMHQDASKTDKSDKSKTIATTQLTYLTEQNLAVTSQMVYFEQPGLKVKSLGMTANLKEQKIKLLQQVWSEYVPEKAD